MNITLTMVSYDFLKEDYEELFGRIAGLKKNAKLVSSITIYYSSNGGMTAYVRPTVDLIKSLISHFNLDKSAVNINVVDNVFSAGAFALLELASYVSISGDVNYGVVFHKPVSNDLRNTTCQKALDNYYLKALETINRYGITEVSDCPDELTIPLNKFNIRS